MADNNVLEVEITTCPNTRLTIATKISSSGKKLFSTTEIKKTIDTAKSGNVPVEHIDDGEVVICPICTKRFYINAISITNKRKHKSKVTCSRFCERTLNESNQTS